MQKLWYKLNKKGKPMLGTINELAPEYEVCRKTIIRLWKEVQKQREKYNRAINLNNKRVERQATNKI